MAASPMAEPGTSFSPRSWIPRSMRSAMASMASMLTGSFWQAVFRPLTILRRSKASRRPSFFTTMGMASSTRS